MAIEMPSGQIVFDDDLRYAYPVPQEKGDPQYANGPLWQKIITKAYAEVGLFHGYVGNSCPSIHNHNGVLMVGNPSYDGETCDTRDDLPGKDMGSVCTDLWWYSIADAEDFKKRIRNSLASSKKQDAILRDINRAEVKPGRYVLRHYYPYFGKSRIKHGEAEIYATLQLSDKEIKSHPLPEEGVIEMLMKAFKNISYACVECDRDKYGPIDADISLIFQHYQIVVHWKYPGLGDFFATPKFTGEELSNRDLVIRRIEESRIREYNSTKKQKEDMKTLQARLDRMTLEEREIHDAEIEATAADILAEVKAEMRMEVRAEAEIKAANNGG